MGMYTSICEDCGIEIRQIWYRRDVKYCYACEARRKKDKRADKAVREALGIS